MIGFLSVATSTVSAKPASRADLKQLKIHLNGKLVPMHMKPAVFSLTLRTLASLSEGSRHGVMLLLSGIGQRLEKKHQNVLRRTELIPLRLPYVSQLEKIDFDDLMSKPAVLNEMYKRCVLPGGAHVVNLSQLLFIYEAFKDQPAE